MWTEAHLAMLKRGDDGPLWQLGFFAEVNDPEIARWRCFGRSSWLSLAILNDDPIGSMQTLTRMEVQHGRAM